MLESQNRFPRVVRNHFAIANGLGAVEEQGAFRSVNGNLHVKTVAWGVGVEHG